MDAPGYLVRVGPRTPPQHAELLLQRLNGSIDGGIWFLAVYSHAFHSRVYRKEEDAACAPVTFGG